MSNLIDIYCTYFISKTINSQTEASKNMIGEKAYIIRKKYVDHTYFLFVLYRPTYSRSWKIAVLGKFRVYILC